MSTESSAVSDLLRRVHTRRLQTDPVDTLLFQPASSARAPRGRPARETAPRMFESTEPTPPPIAQPRAIVRPQAPRRQRAWPLIVATLIAGVGGIGAAWYFTSASDLGAPAFAMPVMTMPAPLPVAPAAVAPAVVEAPVAVEPVAAPPTVEPQPAAAPAPTHRGHAKPKRIAKHAKPAATATATAAAVPAPAPEPVKAAPAPAHASRQSMDKENPL